MTSKEVLKREYVKAILEGNAAVFGGAGLSRPSGFVVWKELLRSLASDINLNIDDEHDLTAVAQYVRNHARNRGQINDTILNAYSKEVKMNENIKILTKLPIHTYWTTNYDHLIEEGLKDNNRNADVKSEYSQLSITKHDRDAVVYKMHGDCEHASAAVLTKDDYVRYERNYPYFRDILRGDLLSKTFLFVGFSFDDPNLDSVLNQIRLGMGENVRNHYCFMKRILREDCSDDEEYGYKKAGQDLREEDLRNHGIQTTFIDDYSEITELLKEIEKAVLVNNVFISGSADLYEGYWTKEKVEELAYELSKRLVSKEYRVTSGFGLGIGSAVINGGLSEIYSTKYKHMDEHLCLRPFPQNIVDPFIREEEWRKYRNEILMENGAAIFICGNKKDNDGGKIIANGCMQEFEIAKNHQRIIIPIGTTGDAAREIYEKVKSDIDTYSYLMPYIDVLGTGQDIVQIVDAVDEILSHQRGL